MYLWLVLQPRLPGLRHQGPEPPRPPGDAFGRRARERALQLARRRRGLRMRDRRRVAELRGRAAAGEPAAGLCVDGGRKTGIGERRIEALVELEVRDRERRELDRRNRRMSLRPEEQRELL